MNPLAPSTPVNVASVGISTSATMLTASDHDRASRMMIAPAEHDRHRAGQRPAGDRSQRGLLFAPASSPLHR